MYPPIASSYFLDPTSIHPQQTRCTLLVPTSSTRFSASLTTPRSCTATTLSSSTPVTAHPTHSKGKMTRLKFIEALCPIDRDTIRVSNDGKPVLDDDKYVPDISDREFNTILTQISRVKGDCITVILDCCYSGGATRGAEARMSSPTRHTTIQEMLRAGEKILGDYPDYRSILSNDWVPDMGSHVVLAACEGHQLAMSKAVQRKDGAEEHIGIFTDSLVQALRSGYCTRETTYADLVRFLDQPPHQTPVVAGKRKGARIWYQE